MILLLEGEDVVRNLAKRLLQRQGYEALEANGAEAACQLFDRHADRIQLLLTDVIMPQRNGRALFERLRAKRPTLKVLYVSGHTDNTLAQQGAATPATALLEKPFSVDAPARKICAVLDGTA